MDKSPLTALQRWLIALTLDAVAVVVSYQWLDRPIATFSHGLQLAPKQAVFEPLTHIPDPLMPAAAVIFVLMGLLALSGRTLSRLESTVVVCSLSLPMAETIKDQLKFVFGRYWPETWVQHNPSFIGDGSYGFNWFHSGPWYQSFPSGHTTLTCAVASVLWIAYPRLRPLWALGVAAVVIGLLGADFHFLSDIIAGGFVGVSTGWMATVLYNKVALKPLGG
jgi:membrane-associated phospholipid phosphatase